MRMRIFQENPLATLTALSDEQIEEIINRSTVQKAEQDSSEPLTNNWDRLRTFCVR